MLSLNLPEGALNELLYAGDLVLMSEILEGLRNKFLKWKETFEIKGLKANIGKTKVMVSSGHNGQWSQRMACIKLKLTNVGL